MFIFFPADMSLKAKMFNSQLIFASLPSSDITVISRTQSLRVDKMYGKQTILFLPS